MATAEHMTIDLTDQSAVLVCNHCLWRAVQHPDRSDAWLLAARHMKHAHGLIHAGQLARQLSARARK